MLILWLLACRPDPDPRPSTPAPATPTTADSAGGHDVADVRIEGGTVLTADGRSVGALAVRDGVIVATGDEALALDALDTLHLDGAWATAGLHDSHTHLFAGSFVLPRIVLLVTPDMDAVADKVADYAAEHPDEPWLIGFGWTRLLEDPDGRALAAASPDRPVLLIASSGHSALANPYAMDLAGIDADTPDPPGGEIVRDPATGEATGLLLEGAMKLVVDEALGAYDDDAVLGDLAEWVDEAADVGLTSIAEILAAPGVDLVRPQLYTRLDEAGDLPIRVHFSVPVTSVDDLDWAEQWRDGYETEHVRFAGAKVWVDGALSGQEAWTEAQWAHGSHGSSYVDADALAALVGEAEARSLPLKVHAMGDAALAAAITAFEAHSPLTQPHAIEHASLLDDALGNRLGALGVVASVQPLSRQLAPIGGWADDLPSWEADAAYDFAGMVDAGVPLALGTDFPTVTALDPLTTLASVVDDTREGHIDLATALEGYTVGSGRAAGLEGRLGCLDVGCLADLTLWEADPLATHPRDNRVTGTVVGGRRP